MVALVLAHGARSVPGVRKRGWAAAVPTAALVAWMPFMSEVQGTGLGSMMTVGPGTGVPAPNAFDAAVLGEIERSTWSSGPDARRYGWISRRLLMALARRESLATITDGTTAKGAAYKGAISRLVREGRLYEWERKWAESAIYAEVETDRAYGVGELVRGSLRVRRLVLGSYRLRSGHPPFETLWSSTPSGMRMNGLWPLPTDPSYAQQAVERFLWDSVYEAERARGRSSVGKGTDFGLADATGSVDIGYSLLENRAEPGEPERWVATGYVHLPTRVEIDPDRVMAVDTSPATRAMLESGLLARLTVEYDVVRERWVPVVRFAWRGAADIGGSLVFGGLVEVSFEPEGYPPGQGGKWLSSRSRLGWWAIGSDSPGVVHRGGWMEGWAEDDRWFAGEVEPEQYRVGGVRDDARGRIVVIVRSMQGNSPETHGGLFGDREFRGELIVPIEGWTLRELRRYMVSGVVPDHAMPED